MTNPCLESNNMRDLNRQIKWNAKAGVNVLNKTELERVMEKQRRMRADKEKEADTNPETAFKKVLAERAKRLEEMEKEDALKSPGLRKNSLIKSSPKVELKGGDEQITAYNPLSAPENIDKKPDVTRRLDIRLTKSQGEATTAQSHFTSPNTNNANNKMGKGMSVSMYAPTWSSTADAAQVSNKTTVATPVKSPRKMSSSGWAEDGGRGVTVNTVVAPGRANSNWEGNSSGSSSKSSSPEPEFFKVFAQLRGNKAAEN